MYQIDWNKKIHIHFIGIGGISMSGLAELMAFKGFQVSGSDSKRTSLTTELEKKGISVYYGQRASNIQDYFDLVVYTAAVHEDNPELMEVRRRKIETLTRAELLGQVMKVYELPVAVSGTHGKTTTTSMISEILLADHADPTLSVGGILNSINGNFRIGGDRYFVTEACEYTNSFLSFFPKIGIILNIEEDHLDFFKDIDEIRSSFHRFASLIPSDGLLIINGDIKGIDSVIAGLSCRIVTFGSSPENDYHAANVVFDHYARPTFDLIEKSRTNEPVKSYTLGVTGHHNVINSLAAIALARELSIEDDVIKKALLSFTGTNRRFEYKGEIGGVTIIDDYAHHPTEITATLDAAANYPHKTVWCVFQPHTFSRTKAFLSEFATSLSLADKVVLTDIYPARETDNLGISSLTLADAIAALGTEVYYFPSFDETENFLLENCMLGDLLITMGAGDVQKIGESLLGK